MKNKGSIITVKIIGGLGNQLFGYFFGLAVSDRLGTKLNIDGSLIKFGSNKDRVANVQKFETLADNIFFSNMQNQFSKKLISNKYIRKIYWKIMSKLNPNISESALEQKNFKFQEHRSYSGYFQNWFYVDYYYKNHPFLTFDTIVKTEFFKTTKKRMQILEPICVHLRIGDYLNFPKIYEIIPVNYFSYCINKLKAENPDRPVWIFIESKHDLDLFYKDIVTGSTEIFDKDCGLTDVETFLLLSNSKFLVATNSTFSLWASWFVWKSGNKAYVPYQSFISGASADLMDERWERYDFKNDKFYPGEFNKEKYEKIENEFIDKFK
jgi:hypothetical protein